VLAVLYPAMDGRGVITIPGYRNERVEAVDGFYVIAGHNLLLTELTTAFLQVGAFPDGCVLSGSMRDSIEAPRRLAELAVPRVGRLQETDDPWEPYVLLDPASERIDAAGVFFRDLQAAGRSASTARSYGMDLLRWFRFLWAIDVAWQHATRVEARDFSCWVAVTRKPVRGRVRRQAPGTVNPVTGKSSPGPGYAETTRAHSETVLRRFYDLHLEMGSGPLVNPFPLDRSRRSGRANQHHNPMEPFRHDRKGLYRPTVPQRIPRCIPDEQFDAVFAALSSNRDRAMVAFWVSTGARAAELLGACEEDTDVGNQLIAVVRKGSRAVQQLPASPDAFVWLQLYQIELRRLGVPRGRRQPLWWTLRRPFHPLTYHGAHRMFERVNAALGANWTLHDLRHTAAYRMARDPKMPLTDVQWVLGHAHLSTTQLYTTPTRDEVIKTVRAHHARYGATLAQPAPPVPAAGYRPESLHTLFAR
jgi:site-specific recombinase XerD